MARKKQNETMAMEETVSPTTQPKTRRTLSIVIVAVFLVIGAGLAYKYLPRSDKTAKAPETETAEAALEQLEKRDFSGAEPKVAQKIKQLIQEAKSNPASAYAWGKLAMNLDVHEFANEAIPFYKEAARLAPQDFRWPYYSAMILAEQNKPEALPLYEKSLALKPGSVSARVRYGQMLSSTKRYQEAAAQFQKAIELDSRSAHAYLGLAHVNFAQSQLKECHENLVKAVQIQPRLGEAHGLLGEIYRRVGKTDLSNRELTIAQQLPKETPIPDEASRELALEGVSSHWYDVRGRAYLEQGNYQTAAQELEQAVAVAAAPDARLHSTLGAAYQYSGRLEDALKQYQAALALNPKAVPAMNNLAATLYSLGKKQEAFATIQKAMEIEPQAPYSYLHLARIHLREGNQKAAIEALRLGNQRIPQNQQIALQLAWHLSTSRSAELRNGKEAVRLAQIVAQRTGNQDPEVLDVVSVAFAEVGRYDIAIAAAERALELAGKSELSTQIQRHLDAYKARKPYHE